MAEVASAFVSLMPSAKGFGASTQRQIGPQMDGVAKKTGSRFGKVFAYSSMSPLKAIGGAAIGLFAIAKVKDFFGSAIDEARESQKVSAITAQVIKSTGGAAQISASQVGRLATSISNMTGIDDEAIQSGANLLLTFKNIKNEAGAGNDIFNQTTRIMTDMATAMGTEPKAAAIQLGKALNDPVKGISALSRVGVTFTDQQKKTIESLVAGGKTMDAQKIILKELNSEFGGTAAAAATAGDKFHTTFANFQEAVGTALLPYLDAALTKGTQFLTFLMTNVPPAFAAFKSAIEPVTSAISDLINNHLTVFKTILSALAGGALAAVIDLIGGALVSALVAVAGFLASPIVLIGLLAGAAVYAYTKFASFRDLVQQIIAWFQTSFVPALMQAAAGVQAFATALWARIQPLLPQIQQIFAQIVSTVKSYLTLAEAEVRIIAAAIQFVWQHFGNTMLTYAQRTFQNILTAIKGALNIIQGVVKLVTSLIKGDWSGAWNAIKQIVKGAWQIIGAVVKQGIAQLQSVFGIIKTTLPIIASKAWDLVKAAFAAGVKLAVRQAQELPGKVKAALGALGSLLVSAGQDLIRGFINGIKSMAAQVASEAANVAKGAVGAVKGALGIHSPSRVFHGIGQWTMEGFSNGIDAAGPKVLKSMQDVLDKTLDKVNAYRDKIASALDGVKSEFTSLRDSIASTFAGDLFNVSAIEAVVPDMVKPEQFDQWSQVTQQNWLDQAAILQKKLTTPAQTVGEAFLNNLLDTKGTLKKLSAAFKKLMGWGIPAQFLSQLFSSGNGGLILELASGSKATARQDANLFGQVQTLSDQLGGQVARNQYGPDLKSIRGELTRANNHLRHLDDLDKRLAKALNNAVSHGQKKAS